MNDNRQGMAAIIGFFDGVHKGHRHLAATLLAEADRRGLSAMAVSFIQSPRQVLQPGWQPQLLTTPAERQRLLMEAGMERVAMLDFTPELAQLTARQFMRQVLADRFDVRLLVVGYDTRFGHKRTETVSDYRRYGLEMGIEVVQATALEGCSSSAIRRLIADGEVERAAALLGRCYTIAGTVVHGFGNGRLLGFPTANVSPESNEKLLPASGAYATCTRIDGGRWMPSMTDVGVRPTFHGSRLTVETHLLSGGGDFYGSRAEVMFCHWLRAERQFGSQEELRRQLQRDAERSAELLTPVS